MSMLDQVPVGDLDNWRQVFTDNFDTDVALGQFPAQVAADWSAYPSPWLDSSDFGTYTPKKVVSVKDGILTKYIHTEAGVHMVAALTPKVPGSRANGQLYGRYALRWRSDDLPGYKIAWLLWPDSGQRIEGEIDLPEMNLDSNSVSGFVHRTNGGALGWVHVPIDPDVWHTSIIEWSPDLVVFIHDGVEIYRTDQGVPNTRMHWVIQTETKITDTEPESAVNGNVQLAWVAAWQWDPTVKAPPKPRTVSLVAPATAVGRVTLGLTASEDVTQAKWVCDGKEIGYDSTPPFSRLWDSTRFANGVHQIWAKGRDSRGWFDGAKRTIVVRNPITLRAPDVATGIVGLGVVEYSWFVQVQWVVDGKLVGTRTGAPWSMQWDSRKVADGEHVVYVKASSAPKVWVDGPKQTISVNNS